MRDLKNILFLVIKIFIFMISFVWVIVFADMANEAYKNKYFIDIFIYLLMMVIPFIIYFIIKYMNKGKMSKAEIEGMNIKRLGMESQNLNTNIEMSQINIKDKGVDENMSNLIKCPACGKEVSNQAIACPNCGHPIKKVNNVEIANFCTHCGEKVLSGAQYCTKCGKPTNTNSESSFGNNTERDVNKINYDSTVDYSKPYKKRKNGCAIGCIALIVLIIFCLILGISSFVGNSDNLTRGSSSVLAKELELTAEQEEVMLQVFANCGIGEITSAKLFQKGETQSSYYLADDEVNNIVVWVSNSEKAVNEIYYNDNDIYLNGAVVSQITNYYVKSKDKSNYRVTSQMTIEKLLNYPDTAKFPAISGWKFGIDNGIVIVQSSVTAKNAFGMESTSEFQIKYSGNNIVSLIFDGVEYIK